MWQGSCSSIQGWFVGSRFFTMFSRYFLGMSWRYTLEATRLLQFPKFLWHLLPWESSRIAGVILVILLLFGLCMASSLGLGSEGVGGLMLKNGKPDKAEVCVILLWYQSDLFVVFVKFDSTHLFFRPGEAAHKRRFRMALSYWVTAELFSVCYCWSYGGFPSPTGW